MVKVPNKDDTTANQWWKIDILLVTDDRPGVCQVDGKQRKLLCHKGVEVNAPCAPCAAKATSIRNYHFRDRSAVGMEKLV